MTELEDLRKEVRELREIVGSIAGSLYYNVPLSPRENEEFLGVYKKYAKTTKYVKK